MEETGYCSDESSFMIGPDMRLGPVVDREGKGLYELLAYMGQKVADTQDFVINSNRLGVHAAINKPGRGRESDRLVKIS